MQRSLVEFLVDPLDGSPLVLEAEQTEVNGEVLAGVLRGAAGTYPISEGIPRFVQSADEGQAQVASSFGYKWGQHDSYGSEGFESVYKRWLMERYGFADELALVAHFGAHRRVLEVGCGAGMSAPISLSGPTAGRFWVGLDISSAIDAARRRLQGEAGAHFVQADLMRPPFAPASFDVVFAEGVLHHTPSTERAVKSLAALLAPGGELMFYVYRKKAPVREFTDDYVRGLVNERPPEEVWKAMRPLTQLARALSDLHAEIDVPEDIPLLGIKAGRHNVQRLIYWHFAKLFWNDELTFEENNHVNFDWYHPRYAHRHTEEELRRWCAELGLAIVHLNAQESGFTVRAAKG